MSDYENNEKIGEQKKNMTVTIYKWVFISPGGDNLNRFVWFVMNSQSMAVSNYLEGVSKENKFGNRCYRRTNVPNREHNEPQL